MISHLVGTYFLVVTLSSTTTEEQWPCDFGRKWSLEDTDERDIPGASPPMQPRVHTWPLLSGNKVLNLWCWQTWGRKTGDPAKATDGPESRSAQRGSQESSDWQLALDTRQVSISTHFWGGGGSKGGEALMFLNQALEFKVSPLHTPPKKKEPFWTMWPSSHSCTRSIHCSRL